MSWQSIWSVAELLKRLSIVSSGNNLLNRAQPLMNDASWDSAFLFSPSFPLSQNALDRLWTELDFQLSPCSPLSFPPSPDTHTPSMLNSPKRPPGVNGKGVLSDSPVFPTRWWVTSLRIQRSLSDKPIHHSHLHSRMERSAVSECMAILMLVCLHAGMLSHVCIPLSAQCVHTR